MLAAALVEVPTGASAHEELAQFSFVLHRKIKPCLYCRPCGRETLKCTSYSSDEERASEGLEGST